MRMSVCCPLANLNDLDNGFEALLVRSMSFGDGDVTKALRSVSFNGRETEPPMMEKSSFGSRKKLIEGSLSFKGMELKTKFRFKTPPPHSEETTKFVRPPSHMSRDINGEQLPKNETPFEKKPQKPPMLESDNQRFQAALRLQKVYKSFRTRRQLADCAVLVEQRWWKLLDFAELTRSSVSFFEIEKPESAVSRWSRARTRAAKVGKGLSQDEKARKLALQHWLEAIDPRHRYGHNLQFYYIKWLQCESKQHFFYWLDIGDGKEVNLERCPRQKLQKQCIKYLGPRERSAYEVVVEDGKLLYSQSKKLLDTREGPKDAKWIFVLSASKSLYVGQKNKGTFQHSSFLAGGATLSAGRLVVEDGVLKAVWPHSGHYLPTEDNFEAFMLFLKEHNVDLTIVQKSPAEEGEETIVRKTTSLSEADFFKQQDMQESNAAAAVAATSMERRTDSGEKGDNKDVENLDDNDETVSRLNPGKLHSLEIPKRENMVALMFKNVGVSQEEDSPETPADGYETAEEDLSDEEFEVSKQNLFDEEVEEEYEEPIPKEKIIQRINSHKGMRSYQLAQQLSCKWTTGAGPRIGCVRDYPLELQYRVLEEVNLSPRDAFAFASPRRAARLAPRMMMMMMHTTPTPTAVAAGKSPLSS